MYKITSNGDAAYSETLVYIYLHENGCYVPTTQELATGVCVKIPVTRTVTNEETGESETIKTVEDTPYQLSPGSLKGTEPIVDSIEVVSMQEYMDATMGDMVSTDEIDAILNGGA